MADLTTIDRLKEYMGTVDDKNDVLLSRIVTAASNFCESYCGRTFGSTAYTSEMYDGSGTDSLVLINWPIISVTGVLEYGSSLVTGTDPSASPTPDVLIYAEQGKLVRTAGIWIPLRRYYAVSYTAGYATVPAIIVQAALEVAALMVRKKDHIDLASKGSGQDNVSYIQQVTGDVRDGLNLYRDLLSVRAV